MSIWLLYDDPDYMVNTAFARMLEDRAREHGVKLETVLLSEIALFHDANGTPFCKRNGVHAHPDAVLSRQRHALISKHFECMGIPVFNNSRVCEICNDKRRTYQFLSGLPMPVTLFLSSTQPAPPADTQYPVVIKPACSHGGDRVTVVHNAQEWAQAVSRILPEPALQQVVVSGAGRDLRVYVLNGQILAGVMRTAREGIVSNFKKGGQVELHTLTAEERKLAQDVIDRFAQAGAPLMMAGVDLMYDNGSPVIGEVEDVVGSRMLYQTSDIDIAAMYMEEMIAHLHPTK